MTGLLCLAGLTLAAAPAAADADFAFERIAGDDDRYGTAADLATTTFASSESVLLASGQEAFRPNYPDALAGNYLAGARQDPILLTRPEDLPAATLQAMRDLGVARVTILGGDQAVNPSVAQTLVAEGFTVDRIAGPTRYETAQAVLATVDAESVGVTPGKGRTAVLSSGENFPDALVAGALGYAASFPLLITFPTDLTAETRESIEALDIEFILITGGFDAVSEAVEAQLTVLGIETLRLSGDTRAATAVEVATYAIANLGFVDTHVNLARGDRFADALAGGPHAGQERAPILLTLDPHVLGEATEAFLVQHCPTLQNGHIFGGPGAVGVPVETHATLLASDC